MKSSTPSSFNTPIQSVAYPLDEFYARSGLALPPLDQVEGEGLPEPYRTLLVHERDMTSTLEQFHRGTIHLRLITHQQQGDEYSREVVLALDGNQMPVEFGAIKIYLDRFPKATRREVLLGRYPLGRILRDHGLEYLSRPRGYLRLATDRLINGLLQLNGANLLYGRRNTLFDPNGQPMAEIVEILPPTPGGSAGPRAG